MQDSNCVFKPKSVILSLLDEIQAQWNISYAISVAPMSNIMDTADMGMCAMTTF